MNKLTIKELDLRGKRVFIRVDFNVPLKDGVVTDDTRIRETLPTLKLAIEKGGRLVLASHLGRPKGGPDRAHASVVGITKFVRQAAAGLLMEKELAYIGKAMSDPTRPFVAILGGAKVSDKIEVVENLMRIADAMLIGGGMAYTFLKARGVPIGKSLVEDDKLDLAKKILTDAERKNFKLLLPVAHSRLPRRLRVGRRRARLRLSAGAILWPQCIKREWPTRFLTFRPEAALRWSSWADGNCLAWRL